MAINIRTAEDIDKIRTASKLAAEVLDLIGEHVVPGVTTEELNQICHKHITEVQGGIPATLNYSGFPKSICTSINHQVCHGIPSHKRLKKGDIVNIDVTVIKNGFFGDTSRMYYVSQPAPAAKRLVDVTHKSMMLGIEAVKSGATLGDIGFAIQQYAESQKCSVVREYCGHGIGSSFHEDPQVLHYGKAGTGVKLRSGMVFTIEPMINLGKRHVKVLGDDWTVVTKDQSLSAQWEHTIVVTDEGCEILTLGASGQP